jgi:hypothetical protein
MTSEHLETPSKRPFDSSSDKPRDAPKFFVDRSLGRTLVEELKAAGHAAVGLDELFPNTTKDEDWLRHVGREGWIALSKDARIRFNKLEREQLIEARVYFFLVPDAQMSGTEQRTLVLTNVDRILKLVRKVPAPVIAKLSKSGISVLVDSKWEKSARVVRDHMKAC